MTDDLERKLAGDLLTLVTHDLRNPLAALSSNLDFLRSSGEQMDADSREAVEDGIASCDALANIIANLEIVSRTLRGRSAEGGSVGLEGVTMATVEQARKAAEVRGVTLVASVDEGARGVKLRANGELFARALSNLVHNAIQFSPSRATVRVVVRVEPEFGVVRIEDDGFAIAVAVRESVFTAPGQLAAKADPRGRYSRGLGLLCAKLAAEAAGARIVAGTRTAETGSAFELSAPRI